MAITLIMIMVLGLLAYTQTHQTVYTLYMSNSLYISDNKVVFKKPEA